LKFSMKKGFHMLKSAGLFALPLFAMMLSAQGPPPGGPRGFGPRFGMMSAGPGSRTPVTGAPYSGVQSTQSQQTLGDGNQITRQEESKVYRDTQGRVRIEHAMHHSMSANGQTARTVITIFDPVGGYSYMLDPTAMTGVKTPLPPANSGNAGGHPGHGPGANGAQIQKDDLGTQTINGLSATGTRITETIPAGAMGNQQPLQIVRETWISTDLKVPISIKTSDPRFGNVTMQLTNIVRAEPDAALFQVPSGYTVTAKTREGGRWRQ
jgi:hypothetical protein